MTNQIKAAHILCSTESSDKEEALAKITDIKAKYEAGESFADLAREFSDCPSGSKGGDLGLFGRGAMVEEFDKAAFDLKEDQVSEVVETEFGYHLIHRIS